MPKVGEAVIIVAPAPRPMTHREQTLFRLYAQGATPKQVASIMQLGIDGVREANLKLARAWGTHHYYDTLNLALRLGRVRLEMGE